MTNPPPDLHHLLFLADETRNRAYAPYSGYTVGAALRATDGSIHTGCNVENASYPASICAERTALVKAVSEGVQDFETLVVITRNGGSPCGVCRQMLYEFSPGLRVVCAKPDGTVTIDTTLDKLLHKGFGPKSLENSDDLER
jgi:cytidine deaminase